MKNINNGFYFFLAIVSGLTLGSFLSKYIGQFKYFTWLAVGETFGLESPIVLDLSIVKLTFGFQFEIYIGSIIGLILAIIFFKKII
ncbi:MAG: DUF4321 domain-containing protein [Lachnospirales bacterium]